MLNKHSQVVCTNEWATFWDHGLFTKKAKGRGVGKGDKICSSDLVARPEMLHDPRSRCELIAELAPQGTLVYGDKLPGYTFNLECWQEFVDAIIMLVRDPRDVAESVVRGYGKHIWGQPTVADFLVCGHAWHDYMNAWDGFLPKSKVPCFVVPYPKMADGAANVAEFLGVEPKELSILFQKYFVPKSGLWRESIPRMNDLMSRSYIKIAKRYGVWGGD